MAKPVFFTGKPRRSTGYCAKPKCDEPVARTASGDPLRFCRRHEDEAAASIERIFADIEAHVRRPRPPRRETRADPHRRMNGDPGPGRR